MLTVLPSEDEKILKKYPAKTDTGIVLIGKVNNKEIGYIVVENIGYILKIIGFKLVDCKDYKNTTKEEEIYTDCLLRAAGSYGFNRNMYYVESDLIELDELFFKFGFIKTEDNILKTNLQKIFKQNCSGCK